MQKSLKKIVVLIMLLFCLGTIGFGSYSYAKNNNTTNNLVLSQKYNGKKLDRVKAAIKTKNNYRFLIDSNDTLENIKDFFVAGDKKAKVKQVGNNTFMVRLPLNSTFLSDELSQIDGGTLPGTIGGYSVIEPEVVEGLGLFDSLNLINPSLTLPLSLMEGNSTGTFLNGEETTKLWGQTKLGADTFQEELHTKNKIKVAVLDTGIDYTNTDLDDNYNNTLSYDFVNEDSDAMDDNGHGTQVAGIIGSEVNGAGNYGVNSNSDLVALKVLDANGLGTTYDILEAIDYAKQNNIQVLNMSFGGIGDTATSTVCSAISDAKAQGIYTVVSAGNNNSSTANLIPASCLDSITVGAIDEQNNKAIFSNYGSGVTVYAPGTDIYTTNLNNLYSTVSGTSFSTAFVSGLVGKELAFSGGINYTNLVDNLRQNYNLVGTINIENTGTTITNSTPIQFGSGIFVLPENMNLFSRFDDFRYLSIDDNYIYYLDLKTTDKIYKLKLNNRWISFPETYYRINPKIVFSYKNAIFPNYFNSGEYIKLSDYNIPDYLTNSFSGTSLTDSYNTNVFEPSSLGKYDLNLKFDKISGQKIVDLPGYIIHTDDTYLYYQNYNDDYKIYRIKADGTEQSPNGEKILDGATWFEFTDDTYIYYNNQNDNYKLYKAKKDGSDLNTGGVKVLDIEYNWGSYMDDIYIYYQNTYDNNKLYRIKKDGSEAYTGGTKIIDSDYSYPYFVEGDYIYYQNNNDNYKMYKIKKDGTELATGGIKIVDKQSAMYIFNDLLYIYYADWDYINGGLYRVKKDGSDSNGTGTKILNMPDYGFMMFYNIYSDLEYIYYTDDLDEGKIYRIKSNGSELYTGGSPISSLKYSYIFLKEGDYLYTSPWDGTNNTIYKIKTDGTQETKLSDKFNGYIKSDLNYLYYVNYKYDNITNISTYSYYKVKKDGTDTNLYVEENLTYNSPEITLPTGTEIIRINVDSIIPTGTDYKFSFSNNNSTFTELNKSKLSGTVDIDLISLYGLGFNRKLYFKVEIIGNQNNQTVTPVVNSVEILTGDQIARSVKNVSVYGTSQCGSPYYISNLNLYSENGNIIHTQKVYNYHYGQCGLSWIHGQYTVYNTCNKTTITEDDNNYYIGYQCTGSYGFGGGIVDGYSSNRTYFTWTGRFTVNKSKFDLCAYDSVYCTNPEAPTKLTQQIKYPVYGNIEQVKPGEKIGKYQSGSGIILSADVPNDGQKLLKLSADIYQAGTTNLLHTVTNTGSYLSGSQEVTVPYYGTGSFYWKARVEDEQGHTSEAVDFGTGGIDVVDYELYEGFEPYPFGYKFNNRGISDLVLSGSIEKLYLGNGNSSDFIRRKVPGNKWDMFYNVFDTSNMTNLGILDAFEILKLDQEDNALFNDGNCYGMALSAVLQYSHPDFISKYFSNFSNQIGNKKIWDAIEEPEITTINGKKYWKDFNTITEAIVSMQLSQKSIHHKEAEWLGITNPNQILDELKNNPNNTYLLSFDGMQQQPGFGEEDVYVGHSVIPYKVEGNKIYFWDNNIMYPETKNESAYNQYIEINSDGKWTAPYYVDQWYNYNWTSFNSLSLINLDKLYNNGIKSRPYGFHDVDKLYTLSGHGDLIITDSQGRITGFSGGTVLKEIPGVDIIIPQNATNSGATENTWKQIYLPQKIDGLTVKVISKTSENYDLMIAGGDYYTKLEGVETSTGEIDIFKSTRENLKIDFDDNKTGDYSLLTDNFYNNGTGTIYMDSIKSITEPQEYTISWTGVLDNTNDAVIYQIDTDTDGVYDKMTKLPPIFQDLISPTTTPSFSGQLTAGYSTGSYIETVSINLDAQDNEGGSGIDKTYYAIGTNTGTLEYATYSGSIIINGLGDYTLNFYSIDKFGNIEENKTINFTLTEKPETYSGIISGFVYDDNNNNGIQDTNEKQMAGWKVCIDKNDNGTCEESIEPFILTNNDGYYELNGLPKGLYKIIEIPHTNWNITTPTSLYYDINLGIGQEVGNRNFGNYKYKGNNK